MGFHTFQRDGGEGANALRHPSGKISGQECRGQPFFDHLLFPFFPRRPMARTPTFFFFFSASRFGFLLRVLAGEALGSGFHKEMNRLSNESIPLDAAQQSGVTFKKEQTRKGNHAMQ